MKVSFSKEYKRNYLTIQDDRVLDDNYQLRMITQNDVEGLLKCQERMINGSGLLCYEVSSYQSLASLYSQKKLDMSKLISIFDNIKTTVYNMQSFMLGEEGLILEPEYIFLDIENERAFLAYYPFYEASGEYPLSMLLDFLIEHIDENDIMALEATYQLMDVMMRQRLSISEAIQWFISEYRQEEVPSVIDYEDEEDSEEEKYESEEEDIEEEISFWGKIKKWLFTEREVGKKSYKSKDEIEYKDMVFTDDSKEEGTVYIPWIENSENKLYGIGKKNKYHIDLNRVPLIVGKKSESVDIIIDDGSISRMHAQFMRQGNKYILKDLNSTNGSFKNGVRLNPNESVSIEPGDEIGLGKLKFIYR